jgi:ATP/maltotriose-dependent transcriptional regulator MalT
MSNLAFGYRGLGRYGEARKVAEEAVKLGVATTPTRRLLYQIGVLMDDGSAAAQIEWARSQPREYDLTSAQAQVVAYSGKLREAATLYAQAADLAGARSLTGTAAGYWAHLAITEAFYGDPRRASTRVRDIVARTATAAESPGTIPRFRAAVALGIVGLATEARELVARAQQRYPDATLTRTVLAPSAAAAIAIGRGTPAEAITALEEAVPTEMGTVAALIPTFLRGEAFLLRGDPASARAEYQKVLDHRGSDPFSPMIPLARLGLARASRLAGDTDRSRREYDEFFQLWKEADPDLPLLQRARSERAALDAAVSTGLPAPR